MEDALAVDVEALGMGEFFEPRRLLWVGGGWTSRRPLVGVEIQSEQSAFSWRPRNSPDAPGHSPSEI
jgi:hypothetical protein